MGLVARNGRWYYVRKFRGRLIRKSTGFPVATRATKEAAARKAAELEFNLLSQAEGWTKVVPSVREWWEKTYHPTYTIWKRSPRNDVNAMRAFLATPLGDRSLDTITPVDCEQYLQQRRTALRSHPHHKTPHGLAPSTVERERRVLQTVFQKAVVAEHITTNPWTQVKGTPIAVRERVLTEVEEAVLLTRLSPSYQRFVLFLVGTGLRLDECRGINPATDLNLTDRWVRVMGKGRKMRQVPLRKSLLPVLRTQLEQVGVLWPQRPDTLREAIRTACEARETRPALPNITPHTLRHTFGHRWLVAGGDLYALSKVLGHASIAVTQKHYAYLGFGDLRAALDRVEQGITERITQVGSESQMVETT